MTARLRSLRYSLAINLIILHYPLYILSSAHAQGSEEFLDWSISISKETHYPGEPVLLTLNIANRGKDEERIYFGSHGIGAFSMVIYDDSNKIVAKGDRIRRTGQSTRGFLRVPPAKTGQKSVVLNQWCSTLLPPGKYRIVCRLDYRLRSQATRIPGTEKGFKAGPVHPIELNLAIKLVKTDNLKFKELLAGLASRESREEGQSFRQWLKDRDIAREMLAFTESELAVPYQLDLLRIALRTWLKRDVINSLVQSGTLKGAIGLIKTVEDPPERGIDDVKRQIIDAVYRLRETGKSDIINATSGFVAKYKRPTLGKPID